MSTTVEVKKNTARVLGELKRKYGAKSIDETVRRLINKAESIPDSMFGAHPEMRAFRGKDESKSHEL